jgi:DNA-binding transcriptional LysR family regulator
MEGQVKLLEARATNEMGLSGKIRLAVSEIIGGYLLPPLIIEFHTLYPDILVELSCLEISPPLGTREVDISCSWHPPEHLDAVILWERTMTLKPAASLEYLKKFGEPRSFEDLYLNGHRICDHLLYPKDGAWEAWQKIIQSGSNVVVATNSSWALFEATMQGVGISLQPIGIDVRQPTLRPLDMNGYSVSLTFFLSCHREIKDIPRVRALINWIKSRLFLDT